MGTLPPNPSSSELFRPLLLEMLNASHLLVKPADVIDWPTIEQSFGALRQYPWTTRSTAEAYRRSAVPATCV
jgi:hypothetical protein